MATRDDTVKARIALLNIADPQWADPIDQQMMNQMADKMLNVLASTAAIEYPDTYMESVRFVTPTGTMLNLSLTYHLNLDTEDTDADTDED